MFLFSFFPLKTRVGGEDKTSRVDTHEESHLPFFAWGDAVHWPDPLSAHNFGVLKLKRQPGLITIKYKMRIICHVSIFQPFLQWRIKSEPKPTFYDI